MGVDGLGRVVQVLAVRALRPEEQAVEDMLTGWRNQQLSRSLSFGTIEARERLVRRFLAHADEPPWRWTPGMVDEFFGDLRSERHAKPSTLRSHQTSLRLFCEYVTDPGYGWSAACLQMFGTHPVQVCHARNTATHVQEAEASPGKRAFSRDELQRFFDRADHETERIASLRRKGWLPTFRDATLFKLAYAFGLRRNDVRHLQVVDFSRNPKAPQFGRFGCLHVRHGKAMGGSAPKRRSVLTVFDWSVEVIEQWVEVGLPAIGGGNDLFPSERGSLLGLGSINDRFARYRDELGLAPGLDVHSLRRSYVTHLIEDGIDPLFVQLQVGHEHASTTALYTCVSSDYRTRTLAAALEAAVSMALASPDGRQR